MANIDCSFKSLFPTRDENDSKCIVVMKIIQSFNNNNVFPSDMTQENLIKHAEDRYNFISLPQKLHLSNADHIAFTLYQKGVSVDIAREYVCFRLTEEDIKKWKIVYHRFC